ncbi:hypothetical protein ACF065_05500 [Streptomyces sp. NPDC015232]|uniref:Rv1733c family protein n=1 Tax=unclassified Streptomyces TaxID=2593676 RepID=UPI0036F4FA3C
MSHQEPVGRGPTVPGWGAASRSAVVLVCAIAAICGAVVAGTLWNVGARAAHEAVAHRHRVAATTTGRATEPPVGPGVPPRSVAPAVWKFPDDVRRTGTVDVPPGTPQGRTVTVWVDDVGAPARPPASTADLALLPALAGGTVVAGAVAASGAGIGTLLRRRSDRLRLAAWDREWEQVEPVWSGRLRRGSGPGSGDG